MTNILLPALNVFYRDMMSLEGKIFVLKNIVTHYKDDLKKRETFDREIMGSIATYRDLSKFPVDGVNLFPTGYSYSFRSSAIENEVAIILSREYCLTLSQAYEIFETYLSNIFTALFSDFPEHLVSIGILETKLYLPKESLKEYVKEKLGRQKNNRKYINSLRKLSKHYSEHETKNIYKLNVSVWFDLLSEIRHNIVHNRQVISNKLNEFLRDNERSKLFKEYFDRKKIYDGEIIFLTHEKFSENLFRLNEFAHFVFKSLSVDNQFDPVYRLLSKNVDQMGFNEVTVIR